MQNNDLIKVDRTSLNMELTRINFEKNCNEYYDLILNINNIIEKERIENRPIMEVELSAELVEFLFPNKKIHKNQLFCNL